MREYRYIEQPLLLRFRSSCAAVPGWLLSQISCHRTAAPFLRRVQGLFSLAGLFGLCMKREARPLQASMQILESKQADQTVEGCKRNEAGGS